MYTAVPPPATVCEDVVTVPGPPRSETLKARQQKLQELRTKQQGISRKLGKTRRKQLQRKQRRIVKNVLDHLSPQDKLLAGLAGDATPSYTPPTRNGGTSGNNSDVKGAVFDFDTRFQTVSHGRFDEKNILENAMEEAIEGGDIDLAENINQVIIEEQQTEREEQHMDAREALDRQAREREKKNKKGKKLAWGFESKQRWESKGNM